MVEQLPYTQFVGGSSPSGRTSDIMKRMKKEKVISIFVEKNIFALTDQGRILVSNPLSDSSDRRTKWVESKLPKHDNDGFFECDEDFFEDEN